MLYCACVAYRPIPVLDTSTIVPLALVAAQAISAPGEPLLGNMLPQLYEPVLDGFSTLAFRRRGFERHPATDGGYFSVMQEWHIELP